MLMSNVKFLLCFADCLNSIFRSSTRSFRNDADNVSTSSFCFVLVCCCLSRLMQTLLRRGVKFDKWNSTACCLQKRETK